MYIGQLELHGLSQPLGADSALERISSLREGRDLRNSALINNTNLTMDSRMDSIFNISY
jgi:hypothetical protein